MRKTTLWRIGVALALVVVSLGRTPVTAQEQPVQIVFMHHSTGANLIAQGGVREDLTALGYDFWDHGYNGDGLVDPAGNWLGENWGVPGDNTDPDGWYNIFNQPVTDPPSNTFSHMLQMDVIIFKSCFPASNIESEEMFEDYQRYYLSIRDVIDQHPDKLFIPFTTPPLVPNETSLENAARARRWAEFLTSDQYLSGHPNIAVFDFFSLLANANGYLRSEYRSGEWDSHPNKYANQTVGPIFVTFIDQAIDGFVPGAGGTPTNLVAAAAPGGNINLTWRDNSSDESAFHIERSPDGTSGWTEIGTVGANVTSYADTGLPCSTPFYYRVRAYLSSDSQYSAYSNIAHISTRGCAPALVAPANGSLGKDATPAFQWGAVAGATRYRLKVDNNANFSSPVLIVSKTKLTHTPTATLPDGLYHWHVQARVDGVWGEKSEDWTFTVDTTKPAKPTLISPIGKVKVTTQYPVFQWTKPAGVDHYQIQVDNSPLFLAKEINDKNVASPPYEAVVDLPNGLYYWRVRSVDAAGNKSAWTTAKKFKMAYPAAPTAPTLTTVEAESELVARNDAWTGHDTPDASGGRYLYSSGCTDDTLALAFTGTRLDVIYVKHPALGTFVVEVDGAVLQVVDSSAADSEFGARVSFTLPAGTHIARIYPQSGTIALDAFAVDGPVVPPGAPVEAVG